MGTISQAGSSTLPVVGGLMASLAGSPQLTMNGVLSTLNGVIQSPVQNGPQPTLPALRPQPPPLNPQALAQSFQLPKSVSPYVRTKRKSYDSAEFSLMDTSEFRLCLVCNVAVCQHLFQVFSPVRAAEAASSGAAAAAAADPAASHVSELHACNDTLYHPSLSHLCLQLISHSCSPD